MSLLLFLTHYIRYHNIKTADDLRVTSYCDNSSLLKAEEEFHTRDVDSSSWYLKPDHDVIMTLSEVREGLPFQLISKHVKSQTKSALSPILPDPNNSTYSQTMAQRPHLISVQLTKSKSSTHFQHVEPIFVTNGYITSREIRTLRNELPEYELRAYLQNAMTGQTGSTSPSVGLLTDQPLPDLLTVLGHLWSNSLMAGYRRSRATM
jgi:hypothetical protein